MVDQLDSGFFLDYTSDSHWKERSKPSYRDDQAIIDGVMDFATVMKKVYKSYNISAGTSSKCIDHQLSLQHPTRFSLTENCIFAKNLVNHITTPTFAIQVCND
jgi:hypothetical protein